MAKEICSRCGRRHAHNSSSRSHSPTPVPRIPEHLIPILRTTHCSLLGLDPNFLKTPRFHGAVYNVGIARGYTGSDSGSIAIMKWVRGSHHCNHRDHLSDTLRTVVTAAKVIYHFLRETDARGWGINLNYPKLVSCEGDNKYEGIEALVEPYIHGFTKFNCNTGWKVHSHRTYAKMLQALSHFSYVWSGGQILLCDLQGGVSEEEKVVTLTDPAIISTEQGTYGCSDTGKKGIRNFFFHHTCNKYCEHLTTPKDKKLFFRAVQSTITSGSG